MGKIENRGVRKRSTSTLRPHNPITLRQEAIGVKQNKESSNSKSALRLKHLQKLALWSSGEASIPCLGAFFGRYLAAAGNVMRVLPDPSLFPCQRCETIMQPGHNCTIRINNASKERSKFSSKNVVVFKCSFCGHPNLKRGTPKGYLKQPCPSKLNPSPESEPVSSKRLVETASPNTGSKKRRRKCWTSLKEIAHRTEHSPNVTQYI